MARTRTNNRWRDETLVFLDRVNEVINGLRPYWPLTLRQVYYQLVSALLIENNINEYQKLSRTLTKARLNGIVSWAAIEDRARSRLTSAGWDDEEDFIRTEMSDFLRGYRRDLLQSQDVTLEVWVEKDALSRVIHDVAYDYCVPVVVARGYSSISFVNECRNRIRRNWELGKDTRLLYFGDLDPSGWNMLPAMLETLQEEMGLGALIDGEKYALMPEQVHVHNLPLSIDAMKESDSRTPKYREWLRQQGEDDTLAVELDALDPGTLQDVVREAIEDNLDMALFEEEKSREAEERESLQTLKDKVSEFIKDNR